MELKTGDVVMLKSGGQPLTVAEVKGDDILCLWMGSEGDLFRETLPLSTLERLEIEDDEDEDDEDEEDDEDDE
ncbi:DUF2158 domain-containing protein [Bradyrhizobium diazoefficiens]|uniref:YodC family protein n=1 Tax=Bradyrhizobium diazoefficiens TaxID=1355477 RepID=UPI00190E065E|nr:DUF2158 domain-containing protein [Bradyrhizobium diazoefficiens]QQO36052.1 DUF2158 domain-containing protein [Bradyrhizobium diazoefficiens]